MSASGMSAADLASALGARKRGRGWRAACPAHDDKRPSLDIDVGEDGRALVICRAGCPQSRVIEALADRGYWTHGVAGAPVRRMMRPNAATAAPQPSAEALRIWNESAPCAETLAEAYLSTRGLTMPTGCDALRFHPALRHFRGYRGPALVAGIREHNGHVHAVQATFLAADGRAKASLEVPRVNTGNIGLGAVWLAPLAPRMLMAEGVETALSAMTLTGLPGLAALSAGNLAKVALLPQVRELLICADHDDAGQRGAEAACQRWEAAGLTVRFLIPKEVGRDFNDVLAELVS